MSETSHRLEEINHANKYQLWAAQTKVTSPLRGGHYRLSLHGFRFLPDAKGQ